METKTIIDKIIDALEKRAHGQFNEFARRQLLLAVEEIREIGKEAEFKEKIKEDEESLLKELQHYKDSTGGLYAFDKDINEIFEGIPDKTNCKTAVEAYLVQQIDYLKSIIFNL